MYEFNTNYFRRMNEMPKKYKIKTKSSAKKRFKLTASGKVKAGNAFKRHNLRKRPQDMKNKTRGTFVVSAADTPNIKRMLNV